MLGFREMVLRLTRQATAHGSTRRFRNGSISLLAADAIREQFGFKFYLFPLTSEVVANGLLLAADLGGMAIAISLVTGVPWHGPSPWRRSSCSSWCGERHSG